MIPRSSETGGSVQKRRRSFDSFEFNHAKRLRRGYDMLNSGSKEDDNACQRYLQHAEYWENTQHHLVCTPDSPGMEYGLDEDHPIDDYPSDNDMEIGDKIDLFEIDFDSGSADYMDLDQGIHITCKKAPTKLDKKQFMGQGLCGQLDELKLTERMPESGRRTGNWYTSLMSRVNDLRRLHKRQFPRAFAVRSAFEVRKLTECEISLTCTLNDAGGSMNALHFLLWQWRSGFRGEGAAAALEAARALLESGIRVDAVWRSRPGISDIGRHVSQVTTLGYCIAVANVEGIQMLLEMGANPSAEEEMTTDNDGVRWTPMELLMRLSIERLSSAAAREDETMRITTIVKILLAKYNNNAQCGQRVSASTSNAHDTPEWLKLMCRVPHLDSEDLAQVIKATKTWPGSARVEGPATMSLLEKEFLRLNAKLRNGLCRLLSRQPETADGGGDANPFLAKPCLVRQMCALAAARHGPNGRRLLRESDCYGMQPIDYAAFWLDTEAFHLILDSMSLVALKEEMKKGQGVARVLRQLLGEPISFGDARESWQCKCFGGIEDMDGFVRKWDPQNRYPVEQMPLSLAMSRDWMLRHFEPFGREFNRRVSTMTEVLLIKMAVPDMAGGQTISLDFGGETSALQSVQRAHPLSRRMFRRGARPGQAVIILETQEDRKLLGGFGCLLSQEDFDD